jgi:hypothetical protein
MPWSHAPQLGQERKEVQALLWKGVTRTVGSPPHPARIVPRAEDDDQIDERGAEVFVFLLDGRSGSSVQDGSAGSVGSAGLPLGLGLGMPLACCSSAIEVRASASWRRTPGSVGMTTRSSRPP